MVRSSIDLTDFDKAVTVLEAMALIRQADTEERLVRLLDESPTQWALLCRWAYGYSYEVTDRRSACLALRSRLHITVRPTLVQLYDDEFRREFARWLLQRPDLAVMVAQAVGMDSWPVLTDQIDWLIVFADPRVLGPLASVPEVSAMLRAVAVPAA